MQSYSISSQEKNAKFFLRPLRVSLVADDDQGDQTEKTKVVIPDLSIICDKIKLGENKKVKGIDQREQGDQGKMKLLFVEDDRIIASGRCYSLTQEGYLVTHCVDVKSAKTTLYENSFDLAILDLSLPDGSGYDLCQLIKAKEDIPVIFLTAIDDEVNVVMGLDMGADDYITKPFRIRELLSRLKSVTRRYDKTEHVKTVYKFSNLKIDTAQAKVYKGEREIVLTSLEYRLLLLFANNEGQVLSRNQLLEGLWDFAGEFVNDNTLTVYIKRLREKIEADSQNPAIIKTVRGLGYKGGN